ncbi:MAG: hypothetical protein ACREQM_06610 [Candidatus Dormibacteraceae bacterium]
MGSEAEPEPSFDRPDVMVADYLRRFEAEARSMAPGPRAAAIRRVRALLHDDLLRHEPSSAEARRYLDELGTPAELRAKAAAAHGKRGSSVGLACMAAVLTPTLWPLGVLLLWRARYWTRAEKLVATLVVPGGVPAGFYLWPHLLQAGLGAMWGDVAGMVLPLLTAAVAFYLVITFVLRVDDEALGIGGRPRRG